MPLKKLWLVFAQAATVSLALLFVVTRLKPEWLTGVSRSLPAPRDPAAHEASPPQTFTIRPNSYSEAVRRAVPAVVNTYTTKKTRIAKHPFLNDPLFRQFFGDSLSEPQRSQGLGSGVIVSDLGRTPGINTFENFIQTDAGINPGNSRGHWSMPMAT